MKKTKKIFLFLIAKILLVQTTLILTVVYFFVLGPMAILAKIFSRDFLRINTKSKSFWQERRTIVTTIQNAQKLY